MSGISIISETEFKKHYGDNAILVKKGGYEFYERSEINEIHQKITAFQCFDDITVFAVQAVQNQVKCIMAWRRVA
jgi:hypothetical protein